jgi:hypothetical protein
MVFGGKMNNKGNPLKIKWRCVFAYKTDVFVFYRYAFSKKQAWMNCCRALANIHNVSVGMVMDRFDYDKSNDFTIEDEASELKGIHGKS